MINEYSLVILPLIIFLARIIDVSLGTIRVIFIAKGYKQIAPILGFFEVLIWISVIKEIMTNMTGFWSLVAYAAGFAAGTYIGMSIEERFMKGKVLVRIIARKNATKLIDNLRKNKYVVTVSNAQGKKGPVKIIFTVTNRHSVHKIVTIIKEFNPRAFYSIENIKYAHAINNELPKKESQLIKMWTPHKKGK